MPLYLDDVRPRAIWTPAAKYIRRPCEIRRPHSLNRAVEKLAWAIVSGTQLNEIQAAQLRNGFLFGLMENYCSGDAV
jgi:hypothetical protein